MFKLINIILLVSVCSLIKGQEINTKDILSVTEEIKVSTDRKLYFNGEDIFFSANYFLNGQKTIPTLSNILYIELIECANKKSIIQQKYRINDFNVKSKIRIPNDINSGRYILRAFTQYQRNFSNYNYGYCLLTILNPNSKLVINSHKHVDSVFIAPESGILIDNIKNKVVINIPEKFIQKTDSYFINDEQDHLLKELNVNKAGFLQTEMQFDKSKSYYFSLLLKNGDTLTYSFPEVKQKGLQTNLSHNKHTIKFKAQSIDNNPENQLNLKIVSKNFHKNYSQKIIFSNNIFESVISKNDLSEGINYFLVTNKQNDIKSINTYYYQPKTVKDIAIKTDKETYTRRENVKVSLTIPALEHNIFPNITISVTRDKETSINNSVRSFATHPIILESYLEHSYSIIDQNIIDQLLILFDNQINYEHITRQIKQASNNHLNHIPELRNITISGILRDKNTKVPIEDHNVYLSVPFKNPQIHVYKTRENGEFLFSLNNIYKKADIFLCSETLLKENKEHEILIKSSFPSNIPDLSSIPIILDEKDINFINEVYINAQTQQKFKPTIDTSKTEKT